MKRYVELILFLIAISLTANAFAAPSHVAKIPPTKPQATPVKKPATAKPAAPKPVVAKKPAATEEPKVEASPVATPDPAAEVDPSKKPKAGGSFSKALNGDGSSKNEPVFVKSDTLDVDAKARIFTYRKNVEVTKGDTLITADTVIGKYDDKNQIDTITCEDNVVITRGDRLRATSNHAVYEVKRGTIVMTEQPEVNDRGNILDADKVTIYVDEDRSEAEGNVRVKVVKSNDLSNPGRPGGIGLK